MASYTPNYNLKKPAGTDVVDIADLNGNMDIIDTQLNSLNSNFATLGTIITGSNYSTSVQVPHGTSTLVSTIVLTKGVWIICGYADWQAYATGYRQIAFSDGANPGRNQATTTVGLEDSKEPYQQITRIIATNGETVSLYARQSSGVALSCNPYMYAVKVGIL